MTAQRIRAIAVTAAVFAVATPVALAGGVPKLPDASGHLAKNQFKVKPSTIFISGDSSWFFSGRKEAHNHAAPLKWKSWTSSGGRGSGFDWMNDCKPSCAAGTFHTYPVKLHVWRPRHVGGHFIFTRVTVMFTGKIPSGFTKSFVFHVVKTDPGTFEFASSSQ